jgi:CheY-like chemotaxis protein
MQMILSDEGFPVTTARNGLEALAIVDRNHPSVILLDMRMPVMDGWEFAHAYQARPGPHAPIVVVTAAADARERAKQIHAVDFLAKPFDFDDLVRIVQQFLQRE